MTATKYILAAALTFSAGLAFADSQTTEAAEPVSYEITGDAKKGERVFKKCKACHMVGADAKDKVGPVLNGIVGRPMAAIEGFNYSKGLVELGEEGKVWTPEELAAFLTKPKAYLKSTKMAFAGLRKDSDKENVIAYLARFDVEGVEAE